MQRIIITGGAGFLGSHLCERLLYEGNEIICVDNFYTGNRRNLSNCIENPYFNIIEHDVTQPLNLQGDEIYNLACPASPRHYQANPIHTMKTSVLGSINMLDLASQLKCKIFHSSTSEVYGDPLVHPQKEDYWGHVNPKGERSCYDEGKRAAEALFFDYKRQRNIDIKVARIFNTYGPRMHPEDGRVVSNFIVQALQGKPITLYGDGLQTRSFCYVDDLINGFVRFMGAGDSVNGPINMGNPVEFTIAELAEKVINLTSSRSTIINEPLPADDPKQRQPDISKAKSELDWEPRVSLDQGLVKTIEYFDELLSQESQPDFILKCRRNKTKKIVTEKRKIDNGSLYV